MLRTIAKKHYIGMNAEFRYRGEEPTRIEALSDAGFALAIGLLLISTQSPGNFSELLEFTRDIIPFALCIALIMLVWFQHFIFFLRYGFRNSVIVVLNTILIFIILFYVYPLKFLAKLLVLIYGSLLGRALGMDLHLSEAMQGMMGKGDMGVLMTIYGLGAAGIFLVLMFMYRYALKHADELELNAIEVFDTRASVYANLIMASIPLLSVLVALLVPHHVAGPALSGFIYLLYWPAMTVFGKRNTRKRKALLQ